LNINNLLGWSLSTLAMAFVNKRSTASSEDPSDLNVTEGATKIGNSVPVVFGRAMIKSPLVAYFGDFSSRAYTEEYSAHSSFNAKALVFSLIISYISSVITGHSNPGQPVSTTGGVGSTSGPGTVKDDLTGPLINALFTWLLSWLINGRMLKTTIQKGFKYYLGYQFMVCWTGDNIGIKSIWMNAYSTVTEESDMAAIWSSSVATKPNNHGGVVAHINKPDLFGGVDEGGGFVGDMRIYFGDEYQTADPWMISQMNASSIQTSLRGLTPLYRKFLTIVVPKAYIGKQSSIPETWVEVVNIPNKLGFEAIGLEANPAEVLYDIYTNADWALNEDTNDLDIDSLMALGQTCKDEELGISGQINDVIKSADLIDKIMTHINGVKYVEPTTGKLTFKLIRNDYDVKSLPVANTSNCVSCEFTRLDWSETVSTTSIQFTDSTNDYENSTIPYNDPANIKITDTVSTKSYEYPFFTVVKNVVAAAVREQTSNGYPLASVNIEANRTLSYLRIGSPFLLNWDIYGVANMVMRTTSVELGELNANSIKISAIEDVFGFNTQSYTTATGSGWNEIILYPTGVSIYGFKELPYELTKSRNTYVSALASRPTAITTLWNVWRKAQGWTEFTTTNQTSVWSAIAELQVDVSDHAPNYFLRTNAASPVPSGLADTVLEVTEMGNGNVIERLINAYDYLDPANYVNSEDIYAFSTLVQIDDEIMLCRGISILPNGNYKLYSIIRGACDTVKTSHNKNSLVFFLRSDYMRNVTGETYVCKNGLYTTEQYNITTASVNETEDFDNTKIVTIETTDRSNRPSPPKTLLIKAYPSSYAIVQTKTLVADGLTGVGEDDSTISDDYTTYSPYLDVVDYGYTGGLYENVSRGSTYGFVLVMEAQDKFTEQYAKESNQEIESGCNYLVRLSTSNKTLDFYTDIGYNITRDILNNMKSFQVLPDSLKINNSTRMTYNTVNDNYPIKSYQAFSYTWTQRCSDFPTAMDEPINIKVYTNRNGIISLFAQETNIKMQPPSIVGIFTEEEYQAGNISTYINSYGTADKLFLPPGDYSSSEILVNYSDEPMFIIGSRVVDHTANSIMDKDGNSWIPQRYFISNRIIDVNAVHTDLVELSLPNGTILQSYFNPDKSKITVYYKIVNGGMQSIGTVLP